MADHNQAGPEVIKLFPCSTQLSTKFILQKCQQSLINTTPKKLFSFIGILIFMTSVETLCSVELEKSFITSGPGPGITMPP